MSTINKLDKKTVERVLKIYSYEKDFSTVFKILSVNPVSFLSSLRFYPDLNDEFEELIKYISLNNEEMIYSQVMKRGEFNATTTNIMLKGRNKKRYDIRTQEEKNEDVDAIDERLNILLGLE